MSQVSKKKHLIQSIKQTMNKPSPQLSNNKPGNNTQNSSYSSYLNTAIDYSKDHSVTPYLDPDNRVVYNLDSDSPDREADENEAQELYDEDIMNQIEMEIYGAAKKQVPNTSSENGIYQEDEEQQDYEQPKTKSTPTVTPTIREKRKVNLRFNNLSENNTIDQYVYRSQKSSLPQKRYNSSYNQDYEESKIVEEDQQQQITKAKPQIIKQLHQPVNTQPVKKLNTSNVPQQSRRFINFSINLKLLNSRLKIRRVIKCVADVNTSNRQDAKYLVELDNERKQQKIVGNTEMIHFYQDALIDYYQTLHFS